MATSPIFLVKIIRSTDFRPGVIANAVRTDIRTYARKVIASLEETTENWNEEKPTFVVKRTQVAPTRSKAIELEIGIEGNEKGVKKWKWLDEGTNIRHALMDSEFRPKTRVGTTVTGPGHPPFEPVFISKKHVLLPGLEAREWSRVITNRHMKGRRGVESFSKAMDRAIRRGIVKMDAETKEIREP